MSRQEDEHVSELSTGTVFVRVEPTFDHLFLEVGVPLIPYQEPRGVRAKEILADKAQSPKSFGTHTLRSRLSSYDLKILRDKCEIPSSVKLRLPGDGEAANMTTLNEIGFTMTHLLMGLGCQYILFFIKVLNAYGLVPGQLSPHAWRFISFFIYQCHRLGLQPRLRDLDFDALTAEPQQKKLMTDEIVLGLTSKDKGKEQTKRKKVPLRAEKKVEDLARALQKVKLSEASLAARVEQLEAEKTKIGLNVIQSFKRSKAYTDQRLHDSKKALVYSYNTYKKDVLKDYPDMDMSIYEHKYAREVAADESNQGEESEACVISQAIANPSPSTSRSLGAASAVVTVP
ncbi:hypothetical protein RJ639_004375 [Escallonia herrerae]|uniref:Transposase (putative) gypsy type domain-containing protein n=1 Tax=Escallonia herrerae TaxID=1293975 RepID=A0AA89AV24_9ASTE|nr:hypothetical protein RJ639_004375 [Escallonia herrerae]